MSREIDERVVSMQFDNKQFEANVKTSMSTIDKLKQSLNFKGASKGLENVNAAAKNVNMNGLASGISTVQAKFSALEVMGVTALANITNSAVNAGKRMVSALTIAPIKTGFQEYETQINAVQTILANTSSKGTTLEHVNAALDELNTYADKTIYNFTEMTRNIGTFTAAGVDLETSVNAIQGIANLAAVSGSTSQQASTAMYQLSQALAAGTVKLMDWNSVVNAGMGGEVFQNALKETSKLLGTGAEAAIKAEGSFRESLRTGWLTSEVLTETLKKFTTSGAAEYIAEYTGLSSEAIEAQMKVIESAKDEASAIDEAAEALAKKSGKNKEEIKSALEMAYTAQNAATKVKTFTQLMDTLKESIQSGWTQTWELLIGDFEEAKSLWTGISDFLTGDSGIITKMSNARNELLGSALGKTFIGLADKINTVVTPAKAAVEVLDNLDTVVDKVMRGEYGNSDTGRFEKLTEEGYNWCEVQNEINEKLGNSYRYTEEQIAAQDKLIGKQGESTEKTKEQAEKTVELTDATKKQLKTLVEMDEATLRSKGYTEEQIKAINELKKTAEQLGIPVGEFIDNLDKINGRWLLLNGFKNIGQSIVTIFKSLGAAYREIFPAITADQLFDIIGGFHKLTTYLIVNKETAEALKTTFKGLFAALDIVRRVLGGGLSVAMDIVSGFLGAFNLNILDVTASVGQAIIDFRDWIISNNLIAKGARKVGEILASGVKHIKSWIEAFMDLPEVQEAINSIKVKMEEFKEIGLNAIKGFKNGLEEGIKSIPKMLMDLGLKILESIKGVLGIHSPSTEMYAIGEFTVAGFVNGVKDGASTATNAIKEFFQGIVGTIKSLDWGKIFVGSTFVGTLYLVKQTLDVLDKFAAPFKGFGDMMSGVGDVLSNTADVIEDSGEQIKNTIKSFNKTLKAKAFKTRAEGIKTLAVAIAILSASIWVLSTIDPKVMWNAVAAIAALAGVMAGLTVLIGKAKAVEGFSFMKLSLMLTSLSFAILMMSSAIKKIGKLDPSEAKRGILGFAAIVASIMLVTATIGKTIKGKTAVNINKFGWMMVKLASAIALMAFVIKIMGSLSNSELETGLIVLGGFTVVVGALTLITNLAGKCNLNKFGTMMLKLSVSLGLMTLAIKAISYLTPAEIQKGIDTLSWFTLIIGALALITHLTKDSDFNALGNMMLKMSASMLLMVAVIKLASGMSYEEIFKGSLAILAFTGIITLLAYISKMSGTGIDKLGRTLLAMSASMLIMVAVVKLVSGLSVGEIIKGSLAILAFTGIIAILVKIVKMAGNDAPKIAATLISMSLAIGILAGIAVLLSMISVGDLAKGLVAVSILAAVMSLMIYATKGASECSKNILMMGIAIGIMAASVAILSFIDPGKLAGATIAMSMLLGMFALVVKSSATIPTAMGTLIVLTAAIAILAGAIYLLASLPFESTLGAAASLSLLLLSLSASMMIISKVWFVAPTALLAVGVLTLIVGALAGILYLVSGLPAESTLATATSLSLLLLSLSAACAILTVVGLGGPAALVGIATLAAMIIGIGGLIMAIGALVTEFPKLEQFLNTGIPILEKIGHAIGSFLGNVISGFMEGTVSGLPDMATNLSTFMNNLDGFVEGAKNIDESVFSGIKNLSGAIIALTGANIIESIGSFITGQSSLVEFGQGLAEFGPYLKQYADSVAGIDTAAVTASANAAKTLCQMASTVPNEGGIVSWFAGENSLAAFGPQIASFGADLKTFADNVAGMDTASVTAAANAAKTIAQMANTIPNEGGVAAWFAGENSLVTFGSKIADFGSHLKTFSTNVDGINVEAVTAAANAAKTIAEMANIVPNEGGVAAWFAGENSLAAFGPQIAAFGTNLAEFATNVGDINVEAVTAAANAAKTLAEMANIVPNEGGVAAWFAGDNSLTAFGPQIASFGTSLSEFSTNVSGLNAEAVTVAVKAAKDLASMCNTIPNRGDIGKFGAQLIIFGQQLKQFTLDVAGIDADQITSGVAAIKDVMTELKKTAKDGADGFEEAFKKATPDIKKAIDSLITSVIDAIEDKASDLVDSFTDSIDDAPGAIREYKDDFYSAGSDLVSGFCNGIDENTFKAEARARAMALAALQAAKEALGVESPSKEFYKIGVFTIAGFTKAIDKNMSKSYDAGASIGNSAKKGMSYAISKIADVINSDIDSQPTIRPVLDLSDVSNGARRISGMFGLNPSIGVMANVGAISHMTNDRQNGVNDDIVSAIRDLGDKLDNVSGDTYSLGNITYDDGSNITEAVKSLVRAARVERRT